MVTRCTSVCIIISILLSNIGVAQPKEVLVKRIDSILTATTSKSFNGIVYIAQKNKLLYKKVQGFANIEDNTPFQEHSQFVIGSISKQFTAIMVLQAHDKKLVNIYIPIKNYLPHITQAWADTVTIHHLLTHTHGIEDINKPTAFAVGTQYAYSQIGFHMLAEILEQVHKKPFANMAAELFAACGMQHTFHPSSTLYKYLVKGYTATDSGTVVHNTNSLENYPAAGAFIATAADLHKWNSLVFNAALLKPKTYRRFTTKHLHAIRQHPIFGITKYGYGITVNDTNGLIQFGQTGYAPGFVSLSFYYPKTKTSIIILSNIVNNPNNIKETFSYHTTITNMVKQWLQQKK
jgi:D-alanyl-D-alanine carboxypeptidase